MQLDSIRILDLSRLLPGPYATQLLADAGADVVKVEDTDAGDYARYTPPTTDRDVGALFDSVNRGKRSIAVDLKSAAGREAFYRLVADADVVFEQFRPGVAERLEIGYETLLEYNEDLVYCSLSGYGQTGPYAERAGHDLNYVGLAGLLDMTREDEAMAPQIPGYQIGDLGGGLFAAFSIVGGLLSRELGNGGEYIDVAMTDVVASFSQAISHEALTGDDPRPGETALTGRYPWYDVYEAADGRYVTLAALEPKFWEAFCEETGREGLIDAHGTDDPAELEAVREELESLFASRSQEEWLEALSDETMVGPVCTPAEATEHPQLEARGLIERPADAPPRVGFPAAGSNVPESHDESVPDHGAHTDDLLASVGYDEDELADLRGSGVIL
ncbi:carnitine dehydratase [Natrinema sp. CBA1119]|uniref:CaiB/BaiF CoA transferase family protein n=1 Tax=Natrinema sp. CBA1119 TaxID=1608465 RepID=UPI000BF7247F|nr:CaiB/BaiF CoA-transferase family protein [Natrinema sp. CBA1119]PGF15675.1 carnitine dehydratase [Natrinema sp. CBA1119]